ncbi:MAG: AbrB/MazE/SpoVT family DNA-binding domain-containing protein [Erysipelotrichaceae bacterium]|nr:AbrB/MazE/SpoVT family DNA-binding domain-containing protein [Erysipelotrichaceae bacterium]
MEERRTGRKRVWKLKAGPEGQITIPKEVRDIMDIGEGDELVINVDEKQGIIIIPGKMCMTRLKRAYGRQKI